MVEKIVFYLVKLPFILTLIIFGFMLEFLIELPFVVMCSLDQRCGKRNLPGSHHSILTKKCNRI